MQITIPGPLTDNARNLMRKLGYGEQTKRSGQTSFVKRMGGADFPRYHAYVEDRDGGILINLHVDQKAASYEGSHAHSGEYEGPLVEKELHYLRAWITHWKQTELASTPDPAPVVQKKKKGFFWN